MAVQLHYETVTPLLKKILQEMMSNSIFDPFVLVGGTSLSLRLGHRKSVDIDLFTNATYGSLDFSVFENFFQKTYSYYDCLDKTGIVGLGRSYYIGNSVNDNIKVDLYYYDGIIDTPEIIDGIKLASLEDITSMKIEVISQGGRKKDFWDLHELLKTYSISEMLDLHQQRNEYTHDRESIIAKLSDFTSADEDIDPVCLKHKEWALIKLDFVELMENFLHH